MFRFNKEMYSITINHINGDFKDLEGFIDKIDNFKKFVVNQTGNKNDLASILTAVHDLRQKAKFGHIKPESKAEKINMEFKVEMLNLYYDTVKHFIDILPTI